MEFDGSIEGRKETELKEKLKKINEREGKSATKRIRKYSEEKPKILKESNVSESLNFIKRNVKRNDLKERSN